MFGSSTGSSHAWRRRYTAALVAAVTLLAAGCGSRAGDPESAAKEGCVDTSGDTVKVGFHQLAVGRARRQ